MEIKNYLKELKFVKSTSIRKKSSRWLFGAFLRYILLFFSAANEYYDDNITDTSAMYRNDKFLAMETDLKELLSRLLEKRRQSKRIQDIDVLIGEFLINF